MMPPRFWQQRGSWQGKLLSPLGSLYQTVGQLRRTFSVPYQARVPVIILGNITAGGSGKTPAAIAIAQMLQTAGHKPVFVTRGYLGSVTEPTQVDLTHHSFREVGDEALLLAKIAPCWIGRNRAATVKAAEPHATHIILDDGLQNPTIKGDCNFLVIDGAVGFGNGHLIPAGPLRESLAEALPRLQGCILIGDDVTNLAPQITKPIFKASLQTLLPPDFSQAESYLAFAGIGRPEKFYQSCRAAGLNISATQDFPDHHTFSAEDLSRLQNKASQKHLQLITTAKDYVRLPASFQSQVKVLPISLQFSEPQEILTHIQSSTVARREPS